MVPKSTCSCSGNVRRIQYTFNNTDITEYQPAPCFIDWPEATYQGQVEWNIAHCPNVTEGTFDVVVSVWNPLDGWISSVVTTVEVLERIGPIHIDDFLIVTDHVRARIQLNSKIPFPLTD